MRDTNSHQIQSLEAYGSLKSSLYFTQTYTFVPIHEINHTLLFGAYHYPDFFLYVYSGEIGPGSSVGVATGYELDGPGIESRWVRAIPHLSIPALGPTQPPVQWVPCLSRG